MVVSSFTISIQRVYTEVSCWVILFLELVMLVMILMVIFKSTYLFRSQLARRIVLLFQIFLCAAISHVVARHLYICPSTKYSNKCITKLFTVDEMFLRIIKSMNSEKDLCDLGIQWRSNEYRFDMLFDDVINYQNSSLWTSWFTNDLMVKKVRYQVHQRYCGCVWAFP